MNKRISKIISKFDGLPVPECRMLFDKLESELFKLPQIPKDDYLLEEYYSGGMYCRKIRIPAGGLITGRIYKFDHIETMISGEILIVSADGPQKKYDGFNVIEAKSGKRQAGLALKDTIWMTVCQVPENIPIHQMLDYATVSSYVEYNNFHKNLNTMDYHLFLNEIGMTQEQIDLIVKTDDVCEMPEKFNHIYVGDSKQHGRGLFSSNPINSSDIVCPVRINMNRTIAGRYSNHAVFANTAPIEVDGIFYLMATKNIEKDEEITCNYWQIMSFRSAEDRLCQHG